MQSDMKVAYAMISDFKRGTIPTGTDISEEQQRLIHMLSEDLEIQSQGSTIEQLILLVSRADSIWNNRVATTIDRFYSLQEAGNLVEAEKTRETFIRECPSAWYCNIVSSL